MSLSAVLGASLPTNLLSPLPTPTHPPTQQRRIAGLLLQLAREGPAQVLCVSHNTAFQSMCDTAIHLKPATAAPADEGAAGGGEQRGDAPPKKRVRGRFPVK